MSNAQAIAAVTGTLAKMIKSGMASDYENDPEMMGYSPPAVTDIITTMPPDRARVARTDSQLNLFLYHVGPNAAWRNGDIAAQTRPGEVGPAPLALELYYLLTAYGDDDDDIAAQRLLGRAMRVIHDHPVLREAHIPAGGLGEPDLRASGLAQQVEHVRVVPHGMPMEELSRLWQTFQTQYRVSTAYRASVVLIESRRPVRARPPVLRRGGDDRGVVVAPSLLGPEAPTLLEVAVPDGNPGARPGDALTFRVTDADGATVTATLRHALLGLEHTAALAPGAAPSLFTLTLPSVATVAAGPCVVTLTVTRAGRGPVTTNALPLLVLPRIDSGPTAAGTGASRTVAVGFAPAAHPRQRVVLLLGDREVVAPGPSSETPRASVTFAVPGDVPAGNYRVRLRVDGADSVHVDRTTTPPSFNAPTVTLPA